jgi:hypothetical protein
LEFSRKCGLKKGSNFQASKEKRKFLLLDNYIQDMEEAIGVDKNYMPHVVRRATRIPGDRATSSVDTVNMNVVHDSIADSLIIVKRE